jgi:hypothetical protein
MSFCELERIAQPDRRGLVTDGVTWHRLLRRRDEWCPRRAARPRGAGAMNLILGEWPLAFRCDVAPTCATTACARASV